MKPQMPFHLLAAMGMVAIAWTAAAQHGDREEPGAGPNPRVSSGPIAPKLEGLSDLHFPVTTDSDEAQFFFDQGLRLHYAFNHAEAQRSFQEAQRLDPDCAMAYWGEALVLGPNINRPMPEDDIPVVWAAMQKAVERKDGVTPIEADLIDALAKRYAPDASTPRADLDAAFADAMGALYEKYPDHPDIGTLAASSLMDKNPWNYWRKDGSPYPGTPELMAALEHVLENHPDHIGAIHYYIHATEAHHPRRSEAASDRLLTLAPGAGHLVHMPSHIYMRIGRYADAYDSNELAIKADEGYITQCRNQGIYPLSYYPHNIHFMGWAAVMLGKSEEAIAAARKTAGKTEHAPAGSDFGLFESFRAMPLYFMTRFGKWDDILNEPEPDAEMLYVRGIWHHARALALLAKGRLDDARAELSALDALRDDERLAEAMVGFADCKALLQIAGDVVRGELAAKTGDYEAAVTHLDRAVRFEESLMYNEPPDWYYPVRHTLGAVLLEAARFREAETVYWEDLKRNPENGWSLYGLWQALEAQGRAEEAADIWNRYQAAWSQADVKLQSSRF
jgi:tetratricopeptide (TPR) repeat protein